MIKLKFIFNYNSTGKYKNINKYTLGYTNLIFFILILKKKFSIKDISFKIFFLKNKNVSFFFNKADFKYKKSKHLLTKFSNSLIFNINIYDGVNYLNCLDIYNFFRLYNFLSNVILNLKYFNILTFYKNINFFNI